MDFRIPREPTAEAPSWLGAFAHPAFAIVWTASTCALVGIAMYDTASGWLMTTLDVNPLDVSLVHAATTLPMFLFTLPAGAIADIVDPRRMIIVVSYAIAALMALFAALVSLNFASPLLLLLTTFALSAAWSLNTPAWLSIVPLLVPKPDIPGAIAAHSVGYNISRTVGPALGGLVDPEIRAGRSILDLHRRQSRGNRGPDLVARASETVGVAAGREAQQRAPNRPPARRQQSPAVGDAGANDGDLSVHRGLLGPVAIDRAANRRGRRALRPPPQRDQHRRDPGLAQARQAARAAGPRPARRSRDRPDRGRAHDFRIRGQSRSRALQPPCSAESRGSTT